MMFRNLEMDDRQPYQTSDWCSHVALIEPLPANPDETVETSDGTSAAELKELVASLADTQVLGCSGFWILPGFQGLLKIWLCRAF